MSAENLYAYGMAAWIAVAVVTFVALQFLTAPYGRHARSGWGPRVSSRAGWLIMEVPAVVTIAIFFWLSPNKSAVATVFFIVWQIHYVNRGLIYPFRRRGGDKPMPLVIGLMGLFFNLVNGTFQGYYFFFMASYPNDWLSDPRFLFGLGLFLLGWAGNFHSDQVLMNLRKPGETGYKIPQGGLYRFLSCPNYFSELVEWTGWAILTWSGPGLIFLIWTAANLVPRARSNHRWYLETFPDYPKKRKAVFPFLY